MYKTHSGAGTGPHADGSGLITSEHFNLLGNAEVGMLGKADSLEELAIMYSILFRLDEKEDSITMDDILTYLAYSSAHGRQWVSLVSHLLFLSFISSS